jgi:FkbH-like protein
VPNVYTIDSSAVLTRYPVADYFDPHSRQIGHIPYTPAAYAAIGTTIFRTLVGLRSAPYKVIVLDCDNTLWQGVCGEDGPQGVTLTSGHRALHEFMLRQMKDGMVLCLASKNSEADVWAVFDQRDDLPLKREDLVSWRINWEAKSSNLRSLAAELNVGLDSVIFIDDNPVECAEVRAGCPEVLVLQLPAQSDRFQGFLDHVWALDRGTATLEDRRRTELLRGHVARERYRTEVPTLQEFIDGLRLQVECSEPAPEQLSGICLLTQGTTQCIFTTVRRSDSDGGR